MHARVPTAFPQYRLAHTHTDRRTCAHAHDLNCGTETPNTVLPICIWRTRIVVVPCFGPCLSAAVVCTPLPTSQTCATVLVDMVWTSVTYLLWRTWVIHTVEGRNQRSYFLLTTMTVLAVFSVSLGHITSIVSYCPRFRHLGTEWRFIQACFGRLSL